MNTNEPPANPDSENISSADQHDPKWLLHSLLTNAQDSIYFKDRKSRFIKISPALAKCFGLNDPEEAVGKTDFDFHDREHASQFFDDEQRIMATGVPLKNVEECGILPDGSEAWYSTTKVPMHDDSGTIVGVVGISRDITERKLQERHFQQVTRLYAAMSLMNQTILRARTREELFSEVCRALVESAHIDMAWIGLVKPGEAKVEPAAKFGDNFDYLQRVQVFCDSSPAGGGPVGTAIREGSPQVVNDFQGNPSTAPWHEEARASGWKSCASVPIRIADKVAGALSVYSKSSGYFSEKEVILLKRASADISSALETIDALASLRH